MQSELTHIENTIGQYFDGLYEGDTEKLGRVFHPSASLFIEKDGALSILPVPEWLERVAAREAPAAVQAKRADGILMIDRTGPVNAVAKVTCMLAPNTYTDYLSLIKFDGRWQIVAKAYCVAG